MAEYSRSIIKIFLFYYLLIGKKILCFVIFLSLSYLVLIIFHGGVLVYVRFGSCSVQSMLENYMFFSFFFYEFETDLLDLQVKATFASI